MVVGCFDVAVAVAVADDSDIGVKEMLQLRETLQMRETEEVVLETGLLDTVGYLMFEEMMPGWVVMAE